MSNFNTYRLRMQASREAARGTGSGFNLFAGRSRTTSFTSRRPDDLESNRLAPSQTAPAKSPSGSFTKETAHDRPETGESSAELTPTTANGEGQGSDADADGTTTQNTLRQRRDQSTDESAAGGQALAAEAESEKKKEKESHTFFKHLTPKEPFTVRNQIQRTIFGSWLNILLLAAPVGIAINYIPAVDRKAVFVVNFIAIVPLAGMLGFATEEIALRTGETVGGLLNATFGNAVELIVAIIALIDNEVVIVQTSLIGSILSNLLLVLGMCFFFGGLRRQEQFFNTTVAQTAASLLALAVAGVIVPTVFDLASKTSKRDVAQLSRGTSVILLVVYGAYLFFQLKTHSAVFAQESQKVEAKPFRKSHRNQQEQLAKGESDEEEDEGEEPQLHFTVAVATLTLSTVIIAFCAEFMVDGISSITEGGNISKEFVGLILLPLVGNAAEHATAVTVAIKDKMDLAIGVAVGSSMQVALFIIPLLVIIGWGMGLDDMALSFDPFQVAVLFVSVLLVNYLIADGKSHWLEGMLLMCLYAIIAVCSWWYPTDPELSSSA